jgi:hypothetical protein
VRDTITSEDTSRPLGAAASSVGAGPRAQQIAHNPFEGLCELRAASVSSLTNATADTLLVVLDVGANSRD